MSEIEDYCKVYEADTKHCVSYYMLAAYAYREKKKEWIDILRNKNLRLALRDILKGRRKEVGYIYGKRRSEAMEEYISAMVDYQ